MAGISTLYTEEHIVYTYSINVNLGCWNSVEEKLANAGKMFKEENSDNSAAFIITNILVFQSKL